MNAPRIDLLRHGETLAPGAYCGSTDVALSALGLQQMHEATRGRHWDRIVGSPLQRCARFAQDLAQRLDVPCALEPRLRELHFGRWEGCTAAELQEREPEALQRFWQDPERHPPPEAECYATLRARVLQWRREYRERAPAGERLLVVCHGGPIRVLLAERDGLTPIQALALPVPYAALLPLEP